MREGQIIDIPLIELRWSDWVTREDLHQSVSNQMWRSTWKGKT